MGTLCDLDLGRLDPADALWRHDIALTIRYHRIAICLRRNPVGAGCLPARLGRPRYRIQKVAGYCLLRRCALRADLFERIAVCTRRTCGRIDSGDDAIVGGVAGYVVSQ